VERLCGCCNSPKVPEKNAHPRGGDCSSDEDKDEDEDEVDEEEEDDDKAPAEAPTRASSMAEMSTLVSRTLESESAIANTGSMTEAAKSRILGENILPSASPP